jgi:hypothetical protein
LHTVTVLLLATSAAAHAGNRGCGVDWDYVPDAPGRAALEVSRGAMTGYYRLTKPESVAFDQSLQKIHDVVLAQPHLRPPRGIDLEGWIRQWKSPVCGERDERKPCLGVPVAGEGHMHYSYFFNINGKPQTVTEGWKNADWSITDLGSAHGGGAGAEVSQLGFSLQLTPHGQIDGVPVFKNPATQTAIIVFARSGRPPWTRPVSQQEYLEAAILRLEQEAQKEAALQNEHRPPTCPQRSGSAPGSTKLPRGSKNCASCSTKPGAATRRSPIRCAATSSNWKPTWPPRCTRMW